MSYDDAYEPTDHERIELDALDEALDAWRCDLCGGVRTHFRGCGAIA